MIGPPAGDQSYCITYAVVNNNKPFKILFRRADNNTELDLTPMGLPANSRELSLGSQSQNLPAGNFLAHQVLGTVDQGGLGGHFEDGTIPPPTATGPVYIVQYHHRDHLGTLRLITDEMGGLIEAHDYEPFGVELNPPFGAASRKKYTGHERDESTGLDYMLARYYPSTMGRFLSVDPLWAKGKEATTDWNQFSYVTNNPLRLADPDGRDAGLAPGLSKSERKVIIQTLARAMRDPDFRAAFMAMANDPNFKLVLTTAQLRNDFDNNPNATQGVVQFGHTEPTIQDGTTVGATVKIDPDNVDFSKKSQAPVTLVETTAHEVLHAGNIQNKVPQTDSEEQQAVEFGKKVDSNIDTKKRATLQEKKDVERLLK